MRPVVLIPGFVTEDRPERESEVRLPHRYVAAVAAAGGSPVVVTTTPVEDALAVASAVVLPGGPDVNPAIYGQRAAPETVLAKADRDSYELALARLAIERGLPLLAICRGAQVLNVALGGTLHQHVEHHRSDEYGKGLIHDVEAEPASRVASLCGVRFPAWSSHHQVIDRLGDGLTAVAWSPDDRRLEGAELADGWVVAVQWHPERTAQDDPRQLALFRALVEQAAAGN